MKYFLVFGSKRRPANFVGGKKLDWGQPPVGVYQAETAEIACEAAAQDHGEIATYFAVEGYAWGIDMMERAPATQLGHSGNAMDRIAGHLDRIAALDEQRRQLEAGRSAELESGRDEH